MKTFAKLLCLTLAVLFLTACGAPENTLYDQGLEVVSLLDEMAGNEAYLQAYSANAEILSVIQSATSGDYHTPTAVYSITIPSGSLLAMPDDLSPELERYMAGRSLAAFVSQINASAGVEALAASSICTVGKSFLCRDAADGIYLYTYRDTAPVAVVFTVGAENIVSATGTFLLGSSLPTGSPEEIRSFFSEIPVSVAEITE